MNYIILTSIFVAIFFIDAVISQGHWENYKYQVTTIERQCRNSQYRKCKRYFWGIYKSCKTYTRTTCNNVPVTRTRTGRRCQAGWQPPSCTTAICTPKCRNNQVCKAPPQTCECIRSGSGACTHVPCRNNGRTTDCYPGTCSSDGSTCSCAPGFRGDNCQTLDLKPTLSDCKTRIYDGGRVVAQSDCSAEDVEPLPVWLSTSSPTTIQVSYRADFTTADALPRVNYVQNSPVPLGITLATFSISWPPAQTYNPSQSLLCVNGDWNTPPTSKVCNMEVQWTNIGMRELQHNSTFSVTAQSQSGGQKIGNSDVAAGNFKPTNIVGMKTNRLMKFSVDLRPPTHCLLQPSNIPDNCSCFPIYMDQDVTTNPVIEPLMCDWSDDGSDVDRYHVEVYYMNVGGTGQLEETRTPLYTEDIRPPHNKFRFTCQTSGVYSIQLTVYDRANNSARARQLFNYDGVSKMTINDVPVHVAEADESTGRQWINYLPPPRDNADYELTVVWQGRYKSDARYADTWLKAAKPWTPGNVPCTPTNNCVDDNHGYSFGLRTVDRIENVTGILGYSVGFEVDSQGAIGLTGPREYATVPPTQERHVISIPQKQLTDGHTVAIWFRVSDMAGNSDDVRLSVGLDRTAPEISDDDFKTKTVDDFTSTAYISAKDAESGLKSIAVSIYDITLKLTVWNATRPALTLQPYDSREKRAADERCPTTGNPTTCYCIPTGECFAVTQPVDIDNCLFDRYTEDPLELRYTVTNQAGLTTSGTMKLGILTDVNCRSVPGIGPGVIAAIVIACVILLALLIVIALMVWRWRVHQDPLPPRARTVFNNTFRSRKNADNELYGVHSQPTSNGATRHNKLKLNSIRAKNDNLKRNNVEDDDEYGFVNSGATQSISPTQVDIAKKLAEGKFAVVKRGSLTMGNDIHPVAVKMLKRGFSAAERQLMTKKIEYLSSIGHHPNIVRFVGSYDDRDAGPVMLLELCDVTLKDWLTSSRTVTPDMLEDILIFALNVARAVEFLHSQQIVHRRLGVRNVLLQPQSNGLVAKLIGFGPTDDTSASSAGELAQPLRWMPPESHQSTLPTYNYKTDAWSYGITLWEMYSRGAKPYPKHSSNQVKGLLARRYRMDRPSDCPVELFDLVVKPCWEEDPAARPNFSVICTNIEQFRRAPAGEDYYTGGHRDSGETYASEDTYASDSGHSFRY